MATVNDLISASLRSIGVLAAGESPTFQDSSDGLVSLNGLADQWAAESLMIYTTDSGDFTFSGAGSYTVGVGGNCPILRPVLHDLITVVWFDSSLTPIPIEYPLTKFTDDAWFNVTNKTMTSTQPSHYWWKADFPLAEITLWPIPSANAFRFGRIYYPQQVSEFTALTQTVVLPPGYRRMIVSNLALELCSDYGVDPAPSLVKAATDSLAVVRRANRRISDLSFPWDSLIGGSRGVWNIRMGP